MTKTLFLTSLLCAAAAVAQAGDCRIEIQADQIIRPVSRYLTGACIEDVNHEIYGGLYSQMIYGESLQEPATAEGVSAMWSPVRSGGAVGGFSVETTEPFVGHQSQRITFHGGTGEIGIADSGLNRWGMNYIRDKPYDGCIWARTEKRTHLCISLQNADGSVTFAKKTAIVPGGGWQKLAFTLTPNGSDQSGRFVISLPQPGSVVIGHAFLEPGAWGRFKGLPVRRDVAEALIDEGITILRYGGSMVNTDEYRWENMIGPRDRRPPYQGTWHPHSSNGWGIFDFLAFCEAANIPGIPDLNINESPARMADFMRYANTPAGTDWGRRRAADGHPAPFHLTHVELGNEETVNEDYWKKFKPMAEAMWAADPDVILVVGDFFYNKVIHDPFHFDGGSVRTLATHKKILDLAREHDREVWFDIHIGTEAPPEPGDLAAQRSFIEQLSRLSPGAKYRVAIFEFNANNHALRRALANARGILEAEKTGGRLAVTCSANGLQPDGQNDNGWDQGLLFLNPAQVWLQPPGWVTRMISRNYEPLQVALTVQGASARVDVVALRSQALKTVVVQVVNAGDQAQTGIIRLDNFKPTRTRAKIEQLAGPLNAINTAANPRTITSVSQEWNLDSDGALPCHFPAHSFSIIRME